MDHEKERILVSACLLSIPCQYNGELARLRLGPDWLEKFGDRIIPVCPEQLGGLPTPRKPVEIQGGDGKDVLAGRARVVSEDGEDFTAPFVRGALAVLNIAQVTSAAKMIVQDRSPSCSCMEIYDGSFQHIRKPGLGVCAALLSQNHIELIHVKQAAELE